MIIRSVYHYINNILLKAILEGNGKRTETIIELKDIKNTVLIEMLRFMYTGSVENIKDFASDLLKVAAKYEIDTLKKMCEDIVIQQLTVENSIEKLICAESYNAKKLNQTRQLSREMRESPAF